MIKITKLKNRVQFSSTLKTSNKDNLNKVSEDTGLAIARILDRAVETYLEQEYSIKASN